MNPQAARVQNTEFDLLRYFVENEISTREHSMLGIMVLDPRVFTEPCLSIYEKILKIRSENRPVNYLSLVNENVSIDHIISISNTATNPNHMQYLPDMIEGYKFLSKAYLWRMTDRLKGDYPNPEDYIEAVSELEIKGFLSEKSFEDSIEAYLKSKNGDINPQIITHWRKFNEVVMPQKGELVVVGARTSIGKTTFALNFGVNAASLGQKVLFVSMEMSEAQIYDKIGAILTKRPVFEFKTNHFDHNLFKQEMGALADNFFLEHLPKATTTDVERLVKHYKPDVLIVDYLQLMKDEGSRGETEATRLGKVSGNLKAIASSLNCLALVPAQLNRDNEKQKREPILSDLRDSGCIEQDADIVLLLHREKRDSQNALLLIAKHRTGQTGELFFDFFTNTGRMLEC